MLVGGSPVPGNIVKMQSPRDIFLGTVIVLKLRETERPRQKRRISERYGEAIASLRVSHSVTRS